MTAVLFWIFIEIKHVVCDVYLQTYKMNFGKRAASFWLLPLLRHASVNAVGTAVVVFALTGRGSAAGIAGAVDLVFHAVIDRNKPRVERRAGLWTARIVDQVLHQATFLMIYQIFL